MNERTPRESPIWARALALNALSNPRFVPFAIAGLFAALAIRAVLEPFGDQDAEWIAAAGREMLATHAVPRTNGWSITDGDVPWVMHEWALGPLYAVLTMWLGLAGPLCLGLIAAAITTALLAAATIGRTKRLAAGALTCLVAMALTRECLVEPRPAYVVLGLPLAMLLLSHVEAPTKRRAIACVLLELAWANVHGSFPLGLGVLALSLLAHDSHRSFRALTLALAAAATLVTPYGTDLIGLVARYIVGGDSVAAAIHAHIAEFQPLWAAGPVFGGPFRVLGVVLVIAFGAIGAMRGERSARFLAFGAALLGGISIVHARHVPQAITLSAALLAPTIDRLIANVSLETRPFDAAKVRRAISVACAGIASMATIATCVRGVHADDALGGDALPALAADPRVRDRAAYVAFDASGRFVWLAPSARVFFDPRNDCYRGTTALAAYAIEEGDCVGDCFDATLARAHVEVAIVPDGHAALDSLVQSARYEEVRRESGWHLFAIRTSARR